LQATQKGNPNFNYVAESRSVIDRLDLLLYTPQRTGGQWHKKDFPAKDEN